MGKNRNIFRKNARERFGTFNFLSIGIKIVQWAKEKFKKNLEFFRTIDQSSSVRYGVSDQSDQYKMVKSSFKVRNNKKGRYTLKNSNFYDFSIDPKSKLIVS